MYVEPGRSLPRFPWNSCHFLKNCNISLGIAVFHSHGKPPLCLSWQGALGMCLPTEGLRFYVPGGRRWLAFCTFCMHAQLCQLRVSPWTAARQAPLSMGFSRQEHWSGVRALLQGFTGMGGIAMPVCPLPLPWWDSLKLWFCVFKFPTFDSNMIAFYRTLLHITLLLEFLCPGILPSHSDTGFPWIYAFFLFNMLFVFAVQSLSCVQLLQPHGLQHARLPCTSPSPGVCSNSHPLSWWCHPTISSSAAPFCCPQSFPASGSFPMSWLFTSGGQSMGASASVLPVNMQGIRGTLLLFRV